MCISNLLKVKCAAKENAIDQQISFLKYCHERIDEFKGSIYTRTTIIMAILAFLVSAYGLMVSDFLKGDPPKQEWCYGVLIVCFTVFLVSLSLTMIFGIKALFPVKDRETLENGFNIPCKWRFASSKFVEGKGKREDFDAFRNAARELNTSEKVLEQIIYEMFTMSHQMNMRYDNMRRS